MSAENSTGLPTSWAIVLGSCIISLGLYFGLRSRDGVVQPVDAPTATVPRQTSVASTARAASDIVRVLREASASLDGHKKALTEKCLAPSLAKKPDPPHVKYSFDITFDATGAPIARGVIEDRATARSEVLTCVSDNFPDLRVSPPGQTVRVDVPLELP